MEIFQTFAEISIGILGFTAIVIMFKADRSEWNHNIFNGLISHSMQALLYSILPFILDAYHCSAETIWLICSAVLGAITFMQGIMVMVADKISSMKIKLMMLTFATTISLLQLFNIIGILTFREKGPYLVGITWHVIQSLIIFSMIVSQRSTNSTSSKN